ncbi:hypothetical protein YTPLAS18_18610 [Nitrospira sp.]|nr:hypothetical protein YTPLAS18_18610 [Nitrospira sp.]
MTNREQLIKARLGILALGSELKNIRRACELAGISRSQFYALKKAYQAYGKDGLGPKIRRTPNMPNRTPPSLEQLILMNTQRNPSVSYIRLAEEMKAKGVDVTPSMIRYVWKRSGLSARAARFQWVKKYRTAGLMFERSAASNGLSPNPPSMAKPVTGMRPPRRMEFDDSGASCSKATDSVRTSPAT